jgi:hypothetical protein
MLPRLARDLSDVTAHDLATSVELLSDADAGGAEKPMKPVATRANLTAPDIDGV